MNEDVAKELAEYINGIAVAAFVSIDQDIFNLFDKSY